MSDAARLAAIESKAGPLAVLLDGLPPGDARDAALARLGEALFYAELALGVRGK